MSMKNDRELIKLARENPSVDRIAASLKMAPAAVLKAAKRLGIYLGPKQDRKPKAKSK
jgi:hypothetical protein